MIVDGCSPLLRCAVDLATEDEYMHKKGLLQLIAMLLLILFIGIGNAGAEADLKLQYAKGFQVESLDGCTLVSVQPAWQKDGYSFRYLLVPTGRKVPSKYPPAQIIRVPVRRVVSLSTTHLGYIDAADRTNRLVGLAGFDHVNTPSVRQRIAAGKLKEVGQFTSLRMETMIDLTPDLILVPASGSSYDVHPKLIEAGLPTVLFIDHLESHPLGRLEWIKLLALFFDTSAHAAALFEETAARYRALADMGRKVTARPKIITGAPFQGRWWIAKGNSFVARFIDDAGGDYLWSHMPGVGSTPLDVEAVYAQALSADIWLNPGAWKRTDEAKTADPRFAIIPALQQNRIFNNNKRLNAKGGNDYWESGMLRPDKVLSDLIAILHPELLPRHELVYYRRLER
jgi:iron complex transport system substrate-binding protein